MEALAFGVTEDKLDAEDVFGGQFVALVFEIAHEAAKALVTNRHSQVLCPNCGVAFLTVEDERLDNEHIDRHLKCKSCGAHETSEGSVLYFDTNHVGSAAFEAKKERKQPAVTEQLFQM